MTRSKTARNAAQGWLMQHVASEANHGKKGSLTESSFARKVESVEKPPPKHRSIT